MKFFTKYNRPKSPSAPSCAVDLAEQQYKDDCDIGSVLKRFEMGDKTVIHNGAVFADVSNIGDFASCMEKIRNANNAFADLPAEVRARFGHDPLAVVRFLQDEKNFDEAVRLGLCNPRPKVEEVVNSGTTDKVAEGATPPSASNITT